MNIFISAYPWGPLSTMCQLQQQRQFGRRPRGTFLQEIGDSSIPPQPFLHNWKPAVNGKLTAILVQRGFSTAGGGAPLKGIPAVEIRLS